jgi:hypothetical protein
MQKLVSASIIAIIVASMILAVSLNQAVDAKKPIKPTKCNNIKILVKVNGVEENQTYTANVTLGTGSKQKTGTVEVNETSITLPVQFKKISPCPPIGFPFGGDVNGTEINGNIQSLKKPNKVTVDLS